MSRLLIALAMLAFLVAGLVAETAAGPVACPASTAEVDCG